MYASTFCKPRESLCSGWKHGICPTNVRHVTVSTYPDFCPDLMSDLFVECYSEQEATFFRWFAVTYRAKAYSLGSQFSPSIYWTSLGKASAP